MSKSSTDIQKCKHCKGDLKVRNPKGFCDHLYYPANCEICSSPSVATEGGWEERFDKEFHFIKWVLSEHHQNIKSFIAQEIDRAVQEEREKALKNGGILGDTVAKLKAEEREDLLDRLEETMIEAERQGFTLTPIKNFRALIDYLKSLSPENRKETE